MPCGSSVASSSTSSARSRTGWGGTTSGHEGWSTSEPRLGFTPRLQRETRRRCPRCPRTDGRDPRIRRVQTSRLGPQRTTTSPDASSHTASVVPGPCLQRSASGEHPFDSEEKRQSRGCQRNRSGSCRRRPDRPRHGCGHLPGDGREGARAPRQSAQCFRLGRGRAGAFILRCEFRRGTVQSRTDVLSRPRAGPVGNLPSAACRRARGGFGQYCGRALL